MTPVLERSRVAQQQAPTITSEQRLPVKKVLVTLAAVLVTLLTFEGLTRVVVSLHSPPLLNSLEFDQKKLVALNSVESPSPRIFFLGTSFTNRAIYADRLSVQLQERGIHACAYNLGSSGAYPADELYLLRQAKPTPESMKAIVLEVSPVFFGLEEAVGRVHSEAFKNSLDGSLLLNRKKSIFNELQYQLAKYSQLVRYRDHLLRLARDLPNLIMRPQSADGEPKDSTTVTPHGWCPSYISCDEAVMQESIERRRPRMDELFPPTKSKESLLRYVAIDAEIAECRKFGVPIVLMWLPMHPQYHQWCLNRIGVTEQECQKAIAAAAGRNGVKLIDLHQGLDGNQFKDCDHVNAEGALEITDRLVGSFSDPLLLGEQR